MRILVTGGAGCIGLEVCRRLSCSARVRVLDYKGQIQRVGAALPDTLQVHPGSVLDQAMVDRCVQDCDAVIHLAAAMGVEKTENNPAHCLEVNIRGTENVLKAAVKYGVRRFVFASSSEVYGEPSCNPVKETDGIKADTVYAYSKLAGEELVRAYCRRTPGMSYTILRYFNTYGPYQVAQFAVPNFIRAALGNKAPQVYGPGNQRRSFCYVSDTARGTVAALFSKGCENETLNIGSDRDVFSLKELAALVIASCGENEVLRPFIHHSFESADRTESREVYERYCDLSRAGRLIGYRPEISIRDGLKRTVEANVFFDDWVDEMV